MITLVCGTPGSGKSARAEELFSQTEAVNKYYIATMEVFDAEGEKRVEKHRKAREGKGFITIEIPCNVDRALEDIKDPAHSAVLLECLSNLAGNEMHADGITYHPVTDAELSEMTERISADILRLSDAVSELIVVANMFPEEDDMYDEETETYVRLNNALTGRIRLMADKVVDI
ncbi:MAG: bifunctional adenosylcobinamide kinase/adenosylcobinamide-phosphate guanylyltransferase [Lachnospiraceae bacterium]|nr:bifunctional adenosylcobinamide kinase/adenosylcobinamide-phosphate guanylyltransferase [Lachnospiraceae bacterium]